MSPYPRLGDTIRFSAPGGGDEAEVVHRAGRAVVARRRRGEPVLFVLVALNGWRRGAKFLPHELDAAIGCAIAFATRRRA